MNQFETAPPEPNNETRLLPGLSVGVFVEYPQTARAIRQAGRMRSLSRLSWAHHFGGIPGATEAFRNADSPDLLIVESDSDPDELMQELAALAEECRAHTKVIVIGLGSDNDVELFRSLLKQGVTDFLVAPVTGEQICNAINDAYRDKAEVKLGRITAFIGAGGRTGSSTIAQNVAMSIARHLETEVLLADLDTQFGTVALNFDLKDLYSVTDILKRGGGIDEVLIDRISKPVGDHLRILAIDTNIENISELPARAVEAIFELAQTHARHIILDLPYFWTRRNRKILREADQIVVTATPGLAELRNTQQILKALRTMRPADPDPIIVLNKVGLPKRLEIAPSEFASALGLEKVRQIPFNAPLFSKAVSKGHLVTDLNQNTRITRAFLELAMTLNGQMTQPDRRSVLERIIGTLRKWW